MSRDKHYTPEVSGVTFLTPAAAPELIENLRSDSCLHSENMKAVFTLPHEAKAQGSYFALNQDGRVLSWF